MCVCVPALTVLQGCSWLRLGRDAMTAPQVTTAAACIRRSDRQDAVYPDPTGYAGFAPAITSVATYYNATADYWATYQSVPSGATSFSTVTFITAGVVQLPANAVVSPSASGLSDVQADHASLTHDLLIEQPRVSSFADRSCRRRCGLASPAVVLLHSSSRCAVTSLPDKCCVRSRYRRYRSRPPSRCCPARSSTLGWMFREDIYTAVSPGPSI